MENENIEHFIDLSWLPGRGGGGGGGGSSGGGGVDTSALTNEISNLKRKNRGLEISNNNKSNEIRTERSRSGGLREGLRSYGRYGEIDINRQKSLYNNFFNQSKETLSTNAAVVDNQNELLSKQREILNDTNLKYKNVNMDYQNVITGITMNDRVMDYDLADSGTNLQFQRFAQIVSLILIVAVVALLFLRKFSLL